MKKFFHELRKILSGNPPDCGEVSDDIEDEDIHILGIEELVLCGESLILYESFVEQLEKEAGGCGYVPRREEAIAVALKRLHFVELDNKQLKADIEYYKAELARKDMELKAMR